ncbi:unnamed protein product [Rotaria magnacalcarata]|uniref:NHL repeat containing protein n=3 Tax=Rotaria magnacalcarata TaxID=392030 RepID=A0A815TQH9_9BILA|nr:unnamed protein product [Rotaria magnacalcarata]
MESPSGSASERLNYPTGLTFVASNTLYIADCYNRRVQKLTIGQAAGTTVAEQPSESTSANLNRPTGILVDSNGNIYVSDSFNHRIKLWQNSSLSGTTIAGPGGLRSSMSQLNTPHGLARNSATDTIYIAYYGNHWIMSYASGATAGTVAAGGNGAGMLTTQLNSRCISLFYFDSSSNSLYIASEGGNKIVRWVLNAITWSLVVGHPAGSSGSTSTILYSLFDFILDSMGNIYVSDITNHHIQFFLSGQLNGSTIAGITSTSGTTNQLLYSPNGVALDSELNWYVSDTNNHRVLK